MSAKTSRKYTCIIVEDDEASRLILENYISRIEFLDLKASLQSGKDGYNYLVNNPNIDILLLDINMPEMSGIDLMKLKLYRSDIVQTKVCFCHRIKASINFYDDDYCNHCEKTYDQAQTAARGRLADCKTHREIHSIRRHRDRGRVGR